MMTHANGILLLKKYVIKSISHRQAFEKTKSQIKFPEGEPVLMDEKNMEDAIAIMRDHFLPDDPPSVATDQTLTPDMRNMCLAIL
ncbi:hypothetical protein DPMN_172692 [Dreissena polymorpha]|uniref:Uncharacterized protein n=1 Tax=Dreissena polymorpha TaxID=45954 RepID=A0A9D4E1C1_DREPO|nr:hypothetical protein DPMN_172692 [Dreissena polymorpha]